MAKTKAERLKELIHAQGAFYAVPGVADPWAAMLAEQAGFELLFTTGAGIANVQVGVPDLGLLSMAEVAERVRHICRSVQIPVLADADTGYGNAVSVVRTVRAFEEAGVAGMMLEDQVSPKRCGHFEGKAVIELDEMIEKIRAFRYARRDPNLVLLARTDARAVHGLDEAIRRGLAFAEAGADMVFIEAPLSKEEMYQIGRSIHVPMVANMVEGGKTPICPVAELKEMGYKIATYANMAMRVAGFAMREAFKVLREEGTSNSLLDRMLTWQERQGLVRLPEFQQLEGYLAGGKEPAEDLRDRIW